jgi:type II secretory pathway component PulC
MSKRLMLLNLVLVSAAVVLSVQLVRTFRAAPTLPSPRGAPTPQAAAPATEERARASVPLAAYDVVASKNLFNPSRSEAGTASVAPATKPLLFGIVLKDGAPAAFLEDPVTKKVTGYKVGDAVAGGQLERIEADRVVIRRGEGTFEVLLRDPQKPKAVAVAQPPTARLQPGAQGQPPGVPATIQPPTPAVPRQPSPTLFRRPQAPAAPPVRNAPDS